MGGIDKRNYKGQVYLYILAILFSPLFNVVHRDLGAETVLSISRLRNFSDGSNSLSFIYIIPIITIPHSWNW